MAPLDLVRLTPLIDRTSGKSDVTIGLIDGPVAMNHPELANQYIREVPGNGSGACTQANSTACLHGTFVAGILSAKCGSVAPAICPNCTLLVRPIFAETKAANGEMPSAMPEELAQAISAHGLSRKIGADGDPTIPPAHRILDCHVQVSE